MSSNQYRVRTKRSATRPASTPNNTYNSSSQGLTNEYFGMTKAGIFPKAIRPTTLAVTDEMTTVEK